MRYLTLAGLGALAMTMSACGLPLGPCYTELVAVSLTGQIQTPSGATSVAAGDQVARSNVQDFATLRAVLVDGSRFPGRSVAWTVSGVGSGYLAVVLPADLIPGQAVALTPVQGGGWGVFPASSGGLVTWTGDWPAGATLQGSARILDRAPLRVELDLTLVEPSGNVRRLSATARFSYRRDPTPCT